jgi:hypothetical protein
MINIYIYWYRNEYVTIFGFIMINIYIGIEMNMLLYLLITK